MPNFVTCNVTSTPMEKNLTVYPISSGDMLNIFANDDFEHIKIMDMAGNVVFTEQNHSGSEGHINISQLANATYIIEVAYANRQTARSVFVKL